MSRQDDELYHSLMRAYEKGQRQQQTQPMVVMMPGQTPQNKSQTGFIIVIFFLAALGFALATMLTLEPMKEVKPNAVLAAPRPAQQAPVATVVPQATAVPQAPTSPPVPTQAPIVVIVQQESTHTPEAATETLAPTNTSEPTATDVPTATPEPTAVPPTSTPYCGTDNNVYQDGKPAPAIEGFGCGGSVSGSW